MKASEHPAAEALPRPGYNWPTVAFLFLSPVATLLALVLYIRQEGVFFCDIANFLVMYALTGLAITVGYHRLFTHLSFDASTPVKIFLLFFGAASGQNTLLDWASNHRYHHQYSDREGDPYSITKGFFWAHMGWILRNYETNRPFKNVPDLKKDRWVMFQYNYYLPIFVLSSFVLPTLVGAAFGRPFGGFLWGGVFRMLFLHHCTYMINSVAHRFGRRTFAASNTAVDNPIVALLSFGEGYHSFHHAFPADYRNGVRWYHWDPGKWLIRALSWAGHATHLKRTSPSRVEAARIGQIGAGPDPVLAKDVSS